MKKYYAGDDRRRFKRVIFSAADEVEGLVQLPNSIEVALKIADIGAGGLRFIPQRADVPGIRSGITLHLLRIRGQNQMTFLTGVKMVVKWIIDEPQFAHVMVGCEFEADSEDIRRQIDSFAASETAARHRSNFFTPGR